jgi:hypothetical protein
VKPPTLLLGSTVGDIMMYDFQICIIFSSIKRSFVGGLKLFLFIIRQHTNIQRRSLILNAPFSSNTTFFRCMYFSCKKECHHYSGRMYFDRGASLHNHQEIFCATNRHSTPSLLYSSSQIQKQK